MAGGAVVHTGRLSASASAAVKTAMAVPGNPGVPKLAVTPAAPTTASQAYPGRPARSKSRISSQAASALSVTTSSAKTQRGAATITPTESGMPTTAVSNRLARAGESPAIRGVVTATTAATSHPTEPPRPALEVRERAIELGRAEVRPQGGGHPELGVGDLPQEEVRHPHLAAGPDQQIRIGDAVRV